ncbi:hypothetical protein XENOCAPTIV_001239 [Xenoophorus captivus]|uniref:Uncharacterized protein n=1 Tax=Xenoophorus captivus TaxID=1517983 RepID=A0ABV0Q7C2_9TELE
MLDARTGKDSVPLEHFDTADHSDELDHRRQQTQPSSSDQENESPHHQESPVRRPQRKMMTEDEIVGQAFVFLLAGYETSSNTLAFTCYLLALNPECQHKVQEEVDDFFTRHVSLLSFGPVPLDLKSSSTLGPKDGIYVKITKRDRGEGQKASPSEE